MNIAIDGRTIVHSRSGVGSYAERVVRSLLQMDNENTYHLFLVEPNDHLEAPNLRKVVLPGYNRKIKNRVWENILLPGTFRRRKIDVYFSPAYVLPMLPRFSNIVRPLPFPPLWKELFNPNQSPRYVVTIHDVIFAHSPQYFTPRMRMWQELFVRNAARVAHRIIADSEATKDDLEKHFAIDGNRITVVYPELDNSFRVVTNQKQLELVRATYKLPDRFILYVGTVEPRKNISGLLKAYMALPERLRKKHGLVIAGGVGWYADETMKQIQTLRQDQSIHHLGYIPNDHLPALYNLADVFAFPSYSEGFGYPPLEAMACGVPVICSDRPSLPEIVGDAARLVDPDNTGQISEALKDVLTKPSVAKGMRIRGHKRVKQFGWKKCAEETLEVIIQAATMKI